MGLCIYICVYLLICLYNTLLFPSIYIPIDLYNHTQLSEVNVLPKFKLLPLC